MHREAPPKGTDCLPPSSANFARHCVEIRVAEGNVAEDRFSERKCSSADTLDHAIDDNERGLKDTVRVNPNEVVEIAVRFNTYAGRDMYHCHILEHEDRGMMRPFVTVPSELMHFMG